MTRHVIALSGLIGSGKTTAAMHLCSDHNFRRIRFAGPLKDMVSALGLSREEVDGALKEKPCDLLGGQSPRHAMQTLGTEWGRQLICPDLWIRAWRKAVDDVPAGVGIVVDDLRFPNEVDAVRQFPGATIIRIFRRGQKANLSHASEAHTIAHDVTIHNDGTIMDLLRSIDSLMRERVEGALS